MRALTFITLLTLHSVATSAEVQDGKALFNTTCVACHGPDAKGALPGIPDLTRPDGALSKPDVELVINVINGFQSKGSPMAMPPKGGNPQLSEADVRALIDYLRTLIGR